MSIRNGLHFRNHYISYYYNLNFVNSVNVFQKKGGLNGKVTDFWCSNWVTSRDGANFNFCNINSGVKIRMFYKKLQLSEHGNNIFQKNRVPLS